MNVLHIIAVFAVVHGVITENEWEMGLQDPTSKNAKKKFRTKKIFDFDFRGKIRKYFGTIANQKDSDESSVCSPVAALLPLGKLALGATGSTLNELYEAIGILVEPDKINHTYTYHSDYQAIKGHLLNLIMELRNVTRPFLDVASGLYVSQERIIYDTFDYQAECIFKSSIQKVNFHMSTALAKTINDWVSSQTHEAISKIVSPDDLSPKSSVVIVNAIYFTGTWNTSFGPPTLTNVYTLRGEDELLTMRSNMWYKYAFDENLYAQLVEIPYAEPNLSLLLIVPIEKNGHMNITKILTKNPDYLEMAIDKMTEQYLYLTMPLFRIESHWNLKTLYQEVGLKSIFDHDNSGLTHIAHNERLHVSAAIQKAIVDVHEKGKYFRLHSDIDWSKRPIDVSVEHPFLFYIRLRSQQLLVGKCC